MDDLGFYYRSINMRPSHKRNEGSSLLDDSDSEELPLLNRNVILLY